ncbi:hypothetical protein VCUG_02840 [Vavraia culicis subsp. floridensis]|uniref:Secreted protein n=1 Tax=Vavraia culicis (isolate floridensis) TaxID=948595 RepID=A0A024RE43_VAVCU|nr:uncharacterized protein VCUG_02840 [Vavraia culicis subsp. floridensis]ETA55722.1 hypothetical protein VCUG_02840 [Vavraia culicis subsp. floridensis]
MKLNLLFARLLLTPPQKLCVIIDKRSKPCMPSQRHKCAQHFAHKPQHNCSCACPVKHVFLLAHKFYICCVRHTLKNVLLHFPAGRQPCIRS